MFKPDALSRPLNILVLEPYGGGSHATLYKGWQKYSRHHFAVLELPGRHWKWRSRHSSLTLALQAKNLAQSGQCFDVIFCSEMLNLAEWRGLASDPLARLPAVVYFHENQFTYPLSPGQKRDYHFAYNNLLSAIAADQIWFNSEFHRADFAAAANAWLRRMPDYPHHESLELALRDSLVLPPGIDPPGNSNSHRFSSPPVIGWVARWEHDKRPDRFVQAIRGLVERKFDFRLLVLGKQSSAPDEALRELLQVSGDRVLHCGFEPDRIRYWDLLRQIDIIVSTADHEFFGIAIIEALHAGARPLLPARLSYPEILDPPTMTAAEKQACLYLRDQDLESALELTLTQMNTSGPANSVSNPDVTRFKWENLAVRYDHAIDRIVAQAN